MICKCATVLFILAYVVALAIGLPDTYGWFGADPDGFFSELPTSLLGLPWVFLTRLIPSEQYALLFRDGSPLINLALIWFVCRKIAT